MVIDPSQKPEGGPLVTVAVSHTTHIMFSRN